MKEPAESCRTFANGFPGEGALMRWNPLLATLSRRLVLVAVMASLMTAPVAAQLTRKQKVHDFENLAALYAKRYAPYEWKKALFGFDLFDLRPWLTRIRQSRDDLTFFEVLLEYVASLHDTHTSFRTPSSFVANLGFGVDIYDGRVVIEAINRTRLPLAQYPFEIGDTLVSVDGRRSEEWIEYFSQFRKRGSPQATNRTLADFLTFRPQSAIPRVIDLPDEASVVIERASGQEETYVIPWEKTGMPVRWIGPVSSPRSGGATTSLAASESEPLPSYYDPWLELTNFRLPQDDHLLTYDTDSGGSEPSLRRYVLGLGARNPVFRAGMPANFIQRLGRTASEFHFSGIYEAGGFRIGFLRLPNFAPPSSASAIAELRAEIAFFNENTDALVVDVMRNTGGGCYMLTAASYLIPYPFFFFGEEIRVTLDRINSIAAALEAARLAGQTSLVEIYTAWLEELQRAYRENGALTNPLPACSTQMHGNMPATDAQGNVLAYTKPLILLVDDFTISAGDIFAAMLQDNRRGALVGTRTNGAGGSISTWPAGFYSESFASNTNTLVTRIAPVDVEGYRPFVEAFTDIVVQQILTASECRYAGPPQCPPPTVTTFSSSSSAAAQ
jgi:Peptidase family S41/PDZ domain